MSTARKILSNTIWQIIGRFSMAALAIFTLKIATNYLSVKGYGEYAVTYEFLAFFSIAADMGLFTIAITEMSKDETKISKIIGNVMTLRTIFVVFTMLVAVGSVFLIPKYDGTRIPVAVSIATLSIFFTITNGTITSVLQAKLKMHIASIAQIIGKITMILYMAYIAFYAFPKAPIITSQILNNVTQTNASAIATQAPFTSPDVSGLVPTSPDLAFYHLIIAGVVGNLIMTLVTYYFVRKITPLSFQFDKTLCKEILKKSLPYGIALILNTIYFRIDSILLSLIKDQQEVGIYAVAMRVLEAVSVIPLFFMNSVLPVLTKSIKDNLVEKTKTIIKYSFDFMFGLGVPILIGTLTLAYPLIYIVSSSEFLSRLNEGFYGSDIALQILMFAMVIQFLSTVFMFLLLALDKQTKILWINLSAVIFNIIGNLLIIHYYSFRGSAFISILSALLILILSVKYAYKYFKFHISISAPIKMVISALIMGALVYFLQPISYKYFHNAGLLILIPLAGILYLSLLLLTKAITKDMLKLLKKEEAATPENQL